MELLVVTAIIGILLSISVSGYLQARMRGNEASAAASLYAINQAQYAFMHTCGNQRFAPSLTSLGKPAPGTSEPFLSPDLSATDEPTKSGYLVRMSGTEVTDPVQTCTGETPVVSYQATADPLNPGNSGLKFYGTNTGLVVYENLETFVGKMPETGPPQLGQETTSTPGR